MRRVSFLYALALDKLQAYLLVQPARHLQCMQWIVFQPQRLCLVSGRTVT